MGKISSLSAVVILVACGGSQTSGKAPPPGELPTAEAIMAKHIEVTGGADARRAVKSLRDQGTFESDGPQGSGTFSRAMDGDKLYIEFRSVEGKIAQRMGSDGETMWEVFGNYPARKVRDPQEQAAVRASIDPTRELDWKSDYPSAEVRGTEEVDGVATYVVALTSAAGRTELRYFEVATGLHLMTRVEAPKSELGALDDGKMGGGADMPEELTKFLDYSESGGIKWPMRLESQFGKLSNTIVVTKIEVNPTIDPQTFAIPAEVKESLDRPEGEGTLAPVP